MSFHFHINDSIVARKQNKSSLRPNIYGRNKTRAKSRWATIAHSGFIKQTMLLCTELAKLFFWGVFPTGPPKEKVSVAEEIINFSFEGGVFYIAEF